MIPIIQFDPATLTLWYDTSLIGRCRDPDRIGAAIDMGLRGDDEGLRAAHQTVQDPTVRDRMVNVASAVWHEKRHFVDFALSNYGAFRVRQFFSLYLNLPAVMQEAKRTGTLLSPYTTYLRGVARRELGAPPLSEQCLSFAREIRDRQGMVMEDRQPRVSRFGPMEVGGEAIFEAAAYMVQMSKVHRVFGPDGPAALTRETWSTDLVNAKYAWLLQILTDSGLLKSETLPTKDKDRPTVLIHNDNIILPLCVAATMGRYWKQEQSVSSAHSSASPGERLASLVIALRDQTDALIDNDLEAIWASINGVCKELFGRTVAEEMAADLDCEERYINIANSAQFERALAPLRDYHALRHRLLAILRDAPEDLISQERFCDVTCSNVQPLVIVASTAGEIGEPPEGYEQVLGYKNEKTDHQKHPETRWWWAAAPRFWPKDGAQISLRDRDAWMRLVSDEAPLAKLLLDGRKARVMVGAELLRAEAVLDNWGIRVVFDGNFAFPDLEVTSEYWRFLTQSDTFRCDLSFETVTAPEGAVIGPWDLRLCEGLVEALLDATNDSDYTRLSVWRDWSPWVLSEEYRDSLKKMPRRPYMSAFARNK